MTFGEIASTGDAIDPLEDTRERCQVDGWDGVGSVAVTDAVIAKAVSVAAAIADLLPSSIPGPDFVPEGDGAICLDWMIDPKRIFSLSVGVRDGISFAGHFGALGSEHGSCRINPADPAALRESLWHVASLVSRVFDPSS
jgi:hypothetical protein